MIYVIVGCLYFFGLFFQKNIDEIPIGLNYVVVISSLVVFFVAVVLCLKINLSIGFTGTSIFRLDLSFLLFFYLLYVHPYFLDLLGYADSSFNRFLDDVFFDGANAAIVSAAISALFFSFGVIWGDATKINCKYNAKIFWKKENSDNFAIVFFRINNLLATLSLLLFFVTGGMNTLQGAYTGLASGDVVADGLNFIVSHFYCACFATMFLVKNKINYERLICFVLGNFWALVLLGSGDRNSFLLLVATEFVAFGLLVKKIKIYIIFISAIFAYATYNAVEYARSSGDRSISGVFSAIVDGKKDTSSFDESSFSLTTLTARASMQDLSGFNIPFAKFKLIGFAGVVPFSRRLIVEQGDPFVSSSDVLSEVIIGPDRTWSIGSGIFSDVAIDLGIGGIPIVFFFIGCFAGFIQRWANDAKSSLSYVVYAVAVPLFFEYPRYTLDFPVRNFVWLLGMAWVVKKILAARGAL